MSIMGYSDIDDVQNVMANTLTGASPANTGASTTSLIQIGRTFDFNVVDEDTVEQYIKNSDEEINSAISELYAVPLCQIADFETSLLSDIDNYNDYIITTDRCPFYKGDMIVLTDGTNEEKYTIENVIEGSGSRSIIETEDPISIGFLASDTRVIRVKFPEPVRLMSARLSAANVYEKYFMAEASPSQSEYGKWMRGLVHKDLNNILNGRTILHGQHRIGRRFFNPTLSDQYGLPHNKGQNNMDQLS